MRKSRKEKDLRNILKQRVESKENKQEDVSIDKFIRVKADNAEKNK
jgi:hypothetical protein